jgi:hypothetical protein
MDKRRHQSGQRRVDKAFQWFFDRGILTEDPPNGVILNTTARARLGVTEIHKYFTYNGEKMRFDYQIEWDKPLPKVTETRQFIWDSLNEYMLSLQD